MMKIRATIIPKPRNVSDILRRLGMEASVLLPFLNDYRNLSKAILGYALVEGRKGNTDNALQLMQDAEELANHTGANSHSLIELLSSRRIYDDTMQKSAQICKVLGMNNPAEKFQVRADESSSFFKELRSRPRGDDKALRNAGMYWYCFTPSIPGYRYNMNFEPMRTAEQFFIA